MGALGPAPTEPLRAAADGWRDIDFVVARDVDAARPRAMVLLTPLGAGRVVVGAGSFRTMGSPACSASVLRCLKAGSGTAVVSGLSGTLQVATGILQPDGLCLAAVGSCIAVRAFMLDSYISFRTRGGEAICEKVEGGFMPERFMVPCNGHCVSVAHEGAAQTRTTFSLAKSMMSCFDARRSWKGKNVSQTCSVAAKSTRVVRIW